MDVCYRTYTSMGYTNRTYIYMYRAHFMYPILDPFSIRLPYNKWVGTLVSIHSIIVKADSIK